MIPRLQSPENDAARTLRYERWRVLCFAAMEAASGYSMLVLVRCLDAGAAPKAFANVGYSLGGILGLILIGYFPLLTTSASKTGATVLAVGSIAAAIVPSATSAWVFAGGLVLQAAATSAVQPLLTQIYMRNYPGSHRGHLFSRAAMIRGAAVMLFGYVFGLALEQNVDNFRQLFLILPLGMLASAAFMRRIPDVVPAHRTNPTPLRFLEYLREDRWLRLVLSSWMLMGFPNLVLVAGRSEYLANPKHGLLLSPGQLGLLIVVIPSLMRTIAMPFWGSVFDRLGVYRARQIVHAGLAIGYVFLFSTVQFPGALFAVVLVAFFTIGADLTWALWPTALPDHSRVVDYMGLHTMLSGVRGLIAPFVAFYAIESVGTTAVAFSCALMMLSANMIVAAEWRESLRIGSVTPAAS